MIINDTQKTYFLYEKSHKLPEILTGILIKCQYFSRKPKKKENFQVFSISLSNSLGNIPEYVAHF